MKETKTQMQDIKDFKLGALAGFLTGLFLIPTVYNIGIHRIALLVILPFLGALGIMFGLWCGKILADYIKVIAQIAKFCAVGFLNTAINFGILNLISIATGITSGLLAGWINIPATIIAASNSYVWNKIWVFGKIDRRNFFRDVPKFAIVTIIGILVNSGIIAVFTSYIHPILGLSPAIWLNIGKFIATVVGFLTDFLGYKFIVFVKGKR